MSHNFFQAGWRVLNSLKLVRHWLLEENRILILIIDLWRLFPMAFPCVKSCLGSSSSGELWQQLKPFLQSGLQLQQRHSGSESKTAKKVSAVWAKLWLACKSVASVTWYRDGVTRITLFCKYLREMAWKLTECHANWMKISLSQIFTTSICVY